MHHLSCVYQSIVCTIAYTMYNNNIFVWNYLVLHADISKKSYNFIKEFVSR